MGYAVSLDGFEGPLDLLIHLIKKDKIDIGEISLSAITHDYLEQIKKWQELDLEIASEFVLMAARLLEIKAKALLPGTKAEEEEEDLEIRLLQQLKEYQIFKEISSYLKERQAQELMAIYKDPEYLEKDQPPEKLRIDPLLLAQAFTKIITKEDNQPPLVPHRVFRELFSLEEKIEMIEQALEQAGKKRLSFKAFLTAQMTREEVVITLLALLEIVKRQAIKLSQDHLFGEISIERKDRASGQ